MFVLAAVGIQDTSRLDLAASIRTVKERYFPQHFPGEWDHTEFKGRFIRNLGTRLAEGKGVFSPRGYSTLSRGDFGRMVFDLSLVWRRFRPQVYVVVVDKRELIQKRTVPNPVGLAYTFLQQRLTLQATRVYGKSEGVLLIADEQTTHERYFRKGEIHEARAALTSNLRGAPIDFDAILDKPIWINPSLNTIDREIIQLADIAAYTTAQFVLRNGPPTEKYLFWDAVRPCFATHWNTGLVADGGLAIYPKPQPYPPGLT